MIAQHPVTDFDEITEFLISQGADVNARDNYGNSVLSYGAGNGVNHAKRDMLLKAGAEWTLQAACSWHDVEAIRSCIADGAELDTIKHRYIIQSTLLFALRNGYADIARWFAERTTEIEANFQGSFKQLVEVEREFEEEAPAITALMQDISRKLGMI